MADRKAALEALHSFFKAAEQMRHGGHRDALVATYDGWAHEVPVALDTIRAALAPPAEWKNVKARDTRTWEPSPAAEPVADAPSTAAAYEDEEEQAAYWKLQKQAKDIGLIRTVADEHIFSAGWNAAIGYAAPPAQPSGQVLHEHTFCPHCRPCRKNEELDALRRALAELVALKDLKDAEGKTAYYEVTMPLAWRKARDALEFAAAPTSPTGGTEGGR